MITVFIRTIIIYFILIAAMRLMGKRQIGELQISELAITFILSELAVIPISDKNIPVSHAVIPILLLLSLEVILSFAQTKSNMLKKIFSGSPSIIIHRGKLEHSEMLKHRLEIEELLCELRLKGAFDIGDVEYAILEENGKLSVLLKSEKAPLTPYQMNLCPEEEGIAHTVIVDGEIDRKALKEAGRDDNWLFAALSRFDIKYSDVFLMSVNDIGMANVYVKDPSDNKKIKKQIKIQGGSGQNN